MTTLERLTEALHSSTGQFLLVVLVVMVGPLLAGRIRLPGLIGLILGGFLIGPTGLGLTGEDPGTVDALGALGLLFLMFLAGLELDLVLFARIRTRALVFGVLTFALPMALGLVGSVRAGFTGAAAILIASFWASHTLVSYPIAQRFGLTGTRPVTTAVAGTVITDTLALGVLAYVSTVVGTDASGWQAMLSLVIGLSTLAAYSFLALPLLGRWWFRGPGRSGSLRFLFAVAACYSAGVLAEGLGVDAIVGAFFAGLGVNRLVPRDGALADRLEFVGSTLLVPFFLVSVGLLIAPSVLAQLSTLVLAASFLTAVMGGKILAAVIAGRLQGWTWPERWLVVGLTTPQAAATLAATYVGLSLGLYGDDVVNAVLVVVVVSLVVSTAITTYAAARVPTPVSERAPVGRRVLVGLPDASGPLLRIASLLAEADSGTVQIVRVHLGGSDTLGESQQLTNLAAETVEELGGEASSAVRLDLSVTSALRAAASELEVSAVLVQGMLPLRLGGGFHSPVASGLSVRCPAPVLVVHPGAAPVARILCRVGDDDEAGQSGLAQAVARRLAAAADVSLVSLTGAAPGPVTSGDVVVLTAAFARSPAGRELVTGVTDASGWVVVTTEARLGGSATLLRGGLVGSEVGGA